MIKNFAVLLLAIASAPGLQAQENGPVHLIATITMPDVSGRFDHLAIDPQGQRLFIAARDYNTVEVLDLRAGRQIRSIPGFASPNGVYYVARKLFVASGNDGTCKILAGDSLAVVNTLQLSSGANVITYHPRDKYLYIGHGGASAALGSKEGKKPDPGQIAIVDPASGSLLGSIQTDPELRPGAIALEHSGPRLFTVNALGGQVVVVDRKKRTVLKKWAVPNVQRSGALALDEARHRVFVGTRNPNLIFVFDADTGNQISNFPTGDGIDRVIYDAKLKRLYATGSPKDPNRDKDGFIEAYKQVDADHYELLAKVPTGPGGGTSLLVPETGRLYVALPRFGQRAAEVRVFDTQP